MHGAMQQLIEFHTKMKLSIGDPANPDITTDQALRLNLITEEYQELLEEVDAGNTVGVADALADMVYTIVGAALSWGIDLGSVFDEVHRSNMSKSPDNTRGDGKILKGPDYSPPEIATVLHEVSEECKETGWEEMGWGEPYKPEPKQIPMRLDHDLPWRPYDDGRHTHEMDPSDLKKLVDSIATDGPITTDLHPGILEPV